MVALRHPTSGKWFGFVTRTLVFGSVAAVLHYNILSRIWSALCCHLLGIPLVGYFDDFAALIRAGLAEEALRVFPRFCSLLGFVLKPGKSSVGNAVVSLGLLGTFPSPANNHQLMISLTDEKRTKWSQLIDSNLQTGRISHSCLEKLIGRLSFSLTSIFGKFARTQLRPPYQKFRRRVFNAQLSRHDRCTMEWWRHIIADFAHRIAAPFSPIADWAIYTDAASEPPAICALLFDGKSTRPRLMKECAANVPVTWPYLFRRTNLIYGLELLALLAVLAEVKQLFPLSFGLQLW